METPGRVPVLGVRVSATSYEEVVRLCTNWVEQQRQAIEQAAGSKGPPASRYVCVTSVHGIVTAFRVQRFRELLNEADIATPDGMPVVWAMRSFGAKTQQRVYGPTLMKMVCQEAARRGHRIFLYGGREDAIGALAANLKRAAPGLEIAGAYSPPFRPLTAEEDQGAMCKIEQSRADIVFVGVSTPKQEQWMSDHRDKLPGVVMFGVGAAFDFHAGRVRQAPSWMQRAGLEWFYRLLMEPRRLWRRYILETPQFLPLWALQKIGFLKYS